MRKKYFIRTLSFLVGLFAVVGLTSCGENNDSNLTSLTTDEGIMAFSALSSAQVLSEDNTIDTNEVKLSTLSTTVEDQTTTEGTSEEDLDVVNKYLLMMETLLVDNGPLVLSNGESDLEGYETKAIFSAKDLVGNTTEYTIYYNQELKETKDLDDDDEVEYSLTGIAIINEVEYELIGNKEVEDDELELKISIKLDDNNYVVIKQEIEDDETELAYTIIKDGKKQSTIKIEIENNELKMKLKNHGNGSNEDYTFKKVIVDGVTYIKISYKTNGQKVDVKVKTYIDETTGEVIYEYDLKEKTYKYHYRKQKNKNQFKEFGNKFEKNKNSNKNCKQ